MHRRTRVRIVADAILCALMHHHHPLNGFHSNKRKNTTGDTKTESNCIVLKEFVVCVCVWLREQFGKRQMFKLTAQRDSFKDHYQNFTDINQPSNHYNKQFRQTIYRLSHMWCSNTWPPRQTQCVHVHFIYSVSRKVIFLFWNVVRHHKRQKRNTRKEALGSYR